MQGVPRSQAWRAHSGHPPNQALTLGHLLLLVLSSAKSPQGDPLSWGLCLCMGLPSPASRGPLPAEGAQDGNGVDSGSGTMGPWQMQPSPSGLHVPGLGTEVTRPLVLSPPRAPRERASVASLALRDLRDPLALATRDARGLLGPLDPQGPQGPLPFLAPTGRVSRMGSGPGLQPPPAGLVFLPLASLL